MRIEGISDVKIHSLAMEDRSSLFAALRKRVAAAFNRLDSTEKKRWASSARMLVEILDYFEQRPFDAPECSMVQAVELACAFTVQAPCPRSTPPQSTVH